MQSSTLEAKRTLSQQAWCKSWDSRPLLYKVISFGVDPQIRRDENRSPMQIQICDHQQVQRQGDIRGGAPQHMSSHLRESVLVGPRSHLLSSAPTIHVLKGQKEVHRQEGQKQITNQLSIDRPSKEDGGRMPKVCAPTQPANYSSDTNISLDFGTQNHKKQRPTVAISKYPNLFEEHSWSSPTMPSGARNLAYFRPLLYLSMYQSSIMENDEIQRKLLS